MSSKSHIGRVWPGHEGDHLAGIERRAAAEGDDAVMAAALEAPRRRPSTLASTGFGLTSVNNFA